MKINEVSKFFGLPTNNVEFDKLLTSYGIKQRPKYKQNPFEKIRCPQEGWSLELVPQLGYEKWWGPARENGELIFMAIRVYGAHNDDDYAPYAGELPHGLTFATTLQEAKAILGTPTLNHESDENTVYMWYNFNGYSFWLCYLPSEKEIAFMTIKPKKIKPPVKS